VIMMRKSATVPTLALALCAAAPAAAQSLPAVETQYPFVCTTARNGLGQPKVDNQARQGIPVAEEDAQDNYPRDSRG
jgi:hypothetical protein